MPKTKAQLMREIRAAVKRLFNRPAVNLNRTYRAKKVIRNPLLALVLDALESHGLLRGRQLKYLIWDRVATEQCPDVLLDYDHDPKYWDEGFLVTGKTLLLRIEQLRRELEKALGKDEAKALVLADSQNFTVVEEKETTVQDLQRLLELIPEEDEQKAKEETDRLVTKLGWTKAQAVLRHAVRKAKGKRWAR